MSEREPATRHLCADELRQQLELLGEERKTTLYRKRTGPDPASSISGPSERTVTMLDAGIEALAGEPSLGIGSAREPDFSGDASKSQRASVALRRSVSDTYRLPRLGKTGPLVGGAVVLLGLAILAAAIAWASSPRASAERVPAHAPQSPRAPRQVSSAPLVAAPELAASSGPEQRPAIPLPPPGARSPAGVRVPSARQAVEHLLAGRTRDALDAYRALVAAPGSSAELSVVVSLLEHELRTCAQDKESGRCAQ